MSDERCGCWIEVAGYETVCMLPIGHEIGHDGPCAPLRSELMNEAGRMELAAWNLYDAVKIRDAAPGFRWPYEGPKEP